MSEDRIELPTILELTSQAKTNISTFFPSTEGLEGELRVLYRCDEMYSDESSKKKIEALQSRLFDSKMTYANALNASLLQISAGAKDYGEVRASIGKWQDQPNLKLTTEQMGQLSVTILLLHNAGYIALAKGVEEIVENAQVRDSSRIMSH